jgi:hypothetical protein
VPNQKTDLKWEILAEKLGKDLNDDIALAQLQLASTMTETHIQSSTFLQLFYLLAVDAGNKGSDINKNLLLLEVSLHF